MLNLISTLLVGLAALSASADCFSVSGKAGAIKDVKKPWVLTVYLAGKPGGANYYRLKSFGLNIQGSLDCPGKTRCHSGDKVRLTRLGQAVELKIDSLPADTKLPQDAVGAYNPAVESDEVSGSAKVVAYQPLKLDSAHSDVCFDAFFKSAGSDYKEWSKVEDGLPSKPIRTARPQEVLPQAAPLLEKTADVPTDL